MEWIGLILQIILLGVFLFWEEYNKKKGENQALKEDSRDINYEGEKGKNLATKEDIAQITKEIESVKDSYNKALEAHKIELQKDLDAHKYIVGLCHSLDNILLKHISSCLQSESRRPIGFYENDNKLLNENSKLSLFLSTYKYRYDSSSTLQQLRILSSEIDLNYKEREYISFEDGNNDLYHAIPNEKKNNY